MRSTQKTEANRFLARTLKETFHLWPKLSNTIDNWNDASNEQNIKEITCTQELCAEQSDTNGI